MSRLDQTFALIVRWPQANGLEAHTCRLGRTTVTPRRPKRSRLTGEPR